MGKSMKKKVVGNGSSDLLFLFLLCFGLNTALVPRILKTDFLKIKYNLFSFFFLASLYTIGALP